MKLFTQKKSKGSVRVSIIHQRPNYSETVKFMNTYCVADNPKVDLKRAMHKAFNKAHPNWKISKINLRTEK